MPPRKRSKKPVREPSEEEVFLAQYGELRKQTTEQVTTADGPASVTHKTAGVVQLYKLTPVGWRPTSVPASNLTECLRNGFRTRCGDCGGLCGPEINSCPGRPPRAYRRCPICGKRIYDIAETAFDGTDDGDTALIKDDAYGAATPTVRTRAMLDAHMFAYHPSETATMMPQSPRNPLAGRLPGRMEEVTNA